METYKFQEAYNCIFMRWVAGYLNDIEVVAFLLNAKGVLAKNKGRSTRSNITSYIFVLDNIADKKDGEKIWRGERVRFESSLEKLFKRAGLIIEKKSPITEPHKNLDLQMLWALYWRGHEMEVRIRCSWSTKWTSWLRKREKIEGKLIKINANIIFLRDIDGHEQNRLIWLIIFFI